MRILSVGLVRASDDSCNNAVAAWEQRRNAEQAGINWLFTVDRARTKMGRVYPQPARRAKAAA